MDPTAWTSTRPTTYFATPTYEGSGTTVHPSVLYIPSGFGGTANKWLMVHTPITVDGSGLETADHEDPSVLSSIDGSTWVTPSGVTNPVVNPALGAGSDADLLLDVAGTTLWLVYRHSNTIYVRSTTDLQTWTAETAVSGGWTGEYTVSPTVRWNGSAYQMWYVDGNTDPNTLKTRTCATMDGTWSAATTCTMTGEPAITEGLWHVNVIPDPVAGWWGLLHYRSGGNSLAGLYMGWSSDGLEWTVGARIAGWYTNQPWDQQTYRGSLVFGPSGYPWMYYSGSNDSLPKRWHIGRTQLMAVKTLTQNENATSLSIVAGDDVRLNTFDLNADADITFTRIAAETSGGTKTTGTLTIPAATTRTLTGDLVAGTVALCTLAAGKVLNLTGNVTGGTAANAFGIDVAGGTLAVTGTATGGTSTACYAIRNVTGTWSATTVLAGAIQGASHGGGTGTVTNAGNATLNTTSASIVVTGAGLTVTNANGGAGTNAAGLLINTGGSATVTTATGGIASGAHGVRYVTDGTVTITNAVGGSHASASGVNILSVSGTLRVDSWTNNTGKGVGWTGLTLKLGTASPLQVLDTDGTTMRSWYGGTGLTAQTNAAAAAQLATDKAAVVAAKANIVQDVSILGTTGADRGTLDVTSDNVLHVGRGVGFGR